MPRIGLQAMMIKKSVERVGAFASLARAVDIGYRSFELSQISLTDSTLAEITRAREELGISVEVVSALFTPIPGVAEPTLDRDYDTVVARTCGLGAGFVRLPLPPFAAVLSTQQLLEFADAVEAMAKRLAADGLHLCYHTHHFDFAHFDGVSQFDLLLEHAPSLGFELDVHWAYRGGADPIRLLGQHPDRIKLVHLRDYRVERIRPEHLSAAASGDLLTLRTVLAGLVQDAEVGEGALPMGAIVAAALDAGVSHLFVEQEDLRGQDPYECIALSHRNLVALGYAEHF
ncbi:sugar phosphate isomerase/epimerase family protein [Kribbella sp. NPDC055071]